MEATPSLQSSHCLLEAAEPWSARGNNFVKGAKWSPDGRVVLSAHDDALLRLWPTPYLSTEADADKPTPLEAYASTPEGGSILDFCFYPGFNWDEPATCCFIASSQDHPIHLRDALGGTLRNSYRPYNHVDEVCHAFSLCFSPDGGKIVAGFDSTIRVFDIQRPGRQSEDWKLSTRKGRGQKGIIGAVEGSPLSPGLYAAGSYNRSVCIYHMSSKGKAVAFFADKGGDHSMGGVTQLLWAGEHLLLSGHRSDQWLRAWDLRVMGSSDDADQSRALLHRFPRTARTHQRFLFSAKGHVLACGDDKGDVLFYSMSSLCEVGRMPGAHDRPCVCAIMHPQLDALLTASGGRHFPNYDVDSPPRSRSPSPAKKRMRCAEGAEGRPEGRPPLDNSMRVWQTRW